MAGERVLLHAPDAVCGLAFGAGPIRRTGPWCKAPVPRNRQQLVVECDLPAHRVVANDERARIVHEHLLRHAAEACECALEPGEPARLLLNTERASVQPVRVPERGNEHARFHSCAADLDKALAEVDLQLTARRCLEPRRRQSFGLQRLPVGLDRALDRSLSPQLSEEGAVLHDAEGAIVRGARHRI